MSGQTTVRTCPNCDETFCLQCERGGPCKECGQPLCIVCFALSHHSEAKGACCQCYTPPGADITSRSGDLVEMLKRQKRGVN